MEIPECPVCLQSYDETDQIIPRVLSCGHSACEQCLRRLPRRFPNTVACPACTQLVRYPEAQGPSALPKNIDLLRFISTTKPQPKSPNSNPFTKTPSNPPPEFLPFPWTEDFYSAWRGWILPIDAISVEERVRRGDEFFSLCYGRTSISSSNSDSCLHSSFNRDQSVCLLYFTDSSFAIESGFRVSYTMRVMEALYRMKEQERANLEFIINACSRQRRICRIYGFWMDSEDGSVFLVCEKLDADFMKKLGELNNGLVGSIIKVDDGDEEHGNSTVYDVISGFANAGLGLCEAVMGLHSEGLICGCLAPSCFSSDDYGRFYINLNVMLMTGRRVWRSTNSSSSQRMDDSIETNLSFGDPLKIQAFLSPELFVFLQNGSMAMGHGLDSLHGYTLDVWSVGCILVWLLVGGSFISELLVSFYCNLQKGTEENCDEFKDVYMLWIEKVSSMLEAVLGSQFQALMQILRQCLDYDPENRPHVCDIWKCIRGLLIKPHVDILLSSDVLVKPDIAYGCLILRDWCLLPREFENGSQRQHRSDSQKSSDIAENLSSMSLVGSIANDAAQVSEKIDGELAHGLHSGNIKCMTLQGHLDCITGLAVGGGFLFSSSFDKTVHVWSLQDFSHVKSLKGHEHRVMALLVMDAEKPLCISGDSGAGIFVWDISVSLEQEPLKKWCEHNDWRYSGVHSLAVSGINYLYSGSGDKTIKVWSLQDYSLVCIMNGHNSVVSSLVARNGILYSGSWDGTIRLWWLSDHSPLAVLGDNTPGNVASVLSLSVGCRLLVASHENGFVKMWKNDILVKSLQTHDGAIFATDMAGKWLFTGGWNKIVTVQELLEDEVQVDARMAATISCDSVVTSMLYWQGKLFVGLSDKVIKVYSYGR